MSNTFCIIMAGGEGKRFWPLSRKTKPKQFIDILGVGKTLLQITYDRYKQICETDNIYIVTNNIYKELIYEQLPGIRKENILLEPEAKNTAPCITYALYKIQAQDKNAQVIVAPADHIIINETEFQKTITAGLSFVKERNILLTLGITAQSPETEYGYIQLSSESPTFKQNGYLIHKVKTFTEKPHLDLAKKFIESDEFLWNSGIFIWPLATIMNALHVYLPDVQLCFEDFKEELENDREESVIEEIYEGCVSISIDNGVLESAENVYIIPADFGWTDVETWESIQHHFNTDENNNYVANKQSLLYDTKNSVFISKNDKLIVAENLQDYIVVDEEDVLLICKRDTERIFVDELKQNNNTEGEKLE